MKILYEDNHLLVAVKPHNLPTQADSSGDEDFLSQLKAYLKEKYHKPGAVYLGLVHRLDRPAAGVMVFARTSKAAARLTAQMKAGTFEKEYIALVEGNLPACGALEDYLIKDAKTNTVRVGRADEPGAKRALLEYTVIECAAGWSRVRVRLHTGRSHQIRVQFASRGWPLVGDARYGRADGAFLKLFSCKIAFAHPVGGRRMEFAAPEDF